MGEPVNAGNVPQFEEIRDGDEILAIVIRSRFSEPGVHFFSRSDFSQQLGFIQHSAGHVVRPHVHNPVPREVVHTQETLFVREGKVRIDLYTEDRVMKTQLVLGAGDVILLCTGGHGLEVLEDASIIEVKQGPYAGTDDKTLFEASR